MIKIIAHDIVNDIAIIETEGWIYVRYGLATTKCDNMSDALLKFSYCLEDSLGFEED